MAKTGAVTSASTILGTKIGTKVATSIIGGTATKAIGAVLPWVGLGLTVAEILPSVLGRGRKQADTWVQSFQNPLDQDISRVLGKVRDAQKAGSLTYDQANEALDYFDTLTKDVDDAAKQFAGLGGQQSKVIDQWRRDSVNKYYGENFGNSRSELTAFRDALKPAAPSTTPTPPPEEPPVIPGGQKIKKAQGAAEQLRKRTAGMFGRSATILGGTANKPTTRAATILGY